MTPRSAALRFFSPAALLVFTVAAACTAPQPGSPLPPAGPGTRQVTGIVVNARTGAPLDRAEVTLLTVDNRKLVAETETGPDGKFSFDRLADGRYILSASRHGYIVSSYQEHDGGINTAIVTGEGLDTTGLVMQLQPRGVIYGSVLDDSGDPVPQAQVSLFKRETRGGVSTVVRSSMSIASPEGAFDFSHLSPGSYYLCASGSPWFATRPHPSFSQDGRPIEPPRSPLDLAYPVTCYPGVADSSSAEAIDLGAGDRISADLAMHAVPAVHITMPIPWPPGNRGFTMPQLHVETFGVSEFVQSTFGNIVQPNTPGGTTATFEISGVAPGHYEVELPGTDGSPSRLTTLDTSGENVAIDPASAAPMTSVTGKLVMAGGTQLPKGLYIGLNSRQGERGGGSAVESDGTFHIPSIRPGEYQVSLHNSGPALEAVRISAQGAAVHNRSVTIGNEPVTLNLTAGAFTGVVTGKVMRNGTAAPGVFVLLIPADARDSPLTNQSDSDGSFEYRRVAAGIYTLLAIEEGWTLEWGRAESLAPYMAKGVKVTITTQSPKADLKDPIETQPKGSPSL